MSEIFSTKDFSFNNRTLSIYRKGKVDQISFHEVTKVEVKKGSDLRRPKLALIFGVILIVLCGKILSSYNFDLGEFFASGVILRILGVLFFVGGIGAYSIYTALPIHPIIEITHADWKESLSILVMIKNGKLASFSKFLRTEFGEKFQMNLSI